MYRLFVVLLFCSKVLCTDAVAQPPPHGQAVAQIAQAPFTKKIISRPKIKNDSSQLQVRSFDARKMQEYRLQKQFQYTDTPVADDIWGQFWHWFWSLFGAVMGNSVAGPLITYTIIFLAVAFAVFGIVKFSGLDISALTGKSRPLAVPYTESVENIHEIDFGSQIDEAIASGNFRLAVRLYYLRTLKGLSDHHLIKWQPEKTNSTYVDEIDNLSTRQQFASLTRNFEYVWYGEFDVDRDHFNVLREHFDQFKYRAG